MTEQEKNTNADGNEQTQPTPIPVNQVTELSANDTALEKAQGETTDNPPSNPKAIDAEEAKDTDLDSIDANIQTDAEEMETGDGVDPDDEDADGIEDEEDEE